jgi:VWFA-related protein
MKHPLRAAALLALALALLLGRPGPAQEGDTLAGLFADSVRVEVVNVDVFVTDKQGRPVAGLGREEFELLVDGQPVEISNFYLSEAGPEGSRAASEPPPAEDAAVTPPAARQAAPPPADQQLLLVIYIDNANLRPVTRNKAFRYLRLFMLRPFGPDDRFMVVSYDRSLNERQPLTDDPRAVVSTLVEMEDLTGFRLQADRERRDILSEIYDATGPGEVSGLASLYAESVFHDLNDSIDALKRLVDSLAGLPGRKAVLYVSDGVAMRAGADVFTAMAERFGQPQEEMRALNYDASRRFETLASQANANRTVIYSVDASGLRPHGNADVTVYRAGRGGNVESTHVANLQDPLFLMANETGGQVIANTNMYQPLLERIGEDFRSYYSLGFVSQTVGSGRYHTIEVKVPGRSGISVRHREGYRDKPVEQRMTESVQAALRFGVEHNPLGVSLEFGERIREDRKLYAVPMTVRIPMSKLVFFPVEQSHRSQLKLFISARSEGGETSAVEQVPYPIVIPSAQMERALASEYHLRHTLKMRPGKQLLAVGVRDELGAVSSIVLRPLEVGS